MNCKACGKPLKQELSRCPNCGEANPGWSGVFQTSTVLIYSGGDEKVYRSVEEVPSRLRNKLLRSTNGANSATILIADRRGRKEIAKAMRSLPGPAGRRLRSTILGAAAGEMPAWLTPARKRAIVALLLIFALLVVALVFGHSWE